MEIVTLNEGNKLPDERDFKTYIESIIQKYVPLVCLTHHIFTVKRDPEKSDSHYGSAFRYPYLQQEILYSQKAFDEWVSGVDQEIYILHEICHSLTDELYAKAGDRFTLSRTIEDARERLTDHITNIVYKLNKNH